MNRYRRSLLLAALGTPAAAVPLSAMAQSAPVEQANAKLTLEWAFQGPQAIFTYAADKGLFSKRGVSVHVDRGSGSTDAVTRVASGADDTQLNQGTT